MRIGLVCGQGREGASGEGQDRIGQRGEERSSGGKKGGGWAEGPAEWEAGILLPWVERSWASYSLFPPLSFLRAGSHLWLGQTETVLSHPALRITSLWLCSITALVPSLVYIGTAF